MGNTKIKSIQVKDTTVDLATDWSLIDNKPSTFTPSSHTHDDRYYTESEVDTKLSAKVNTSALASASVNYANSAGAVAWTNISGKPSSMPASDVYAWAKASSKPSYTASEVGAAATKGCQGYSVVYNTGTTDSVNKDNTAVTVNDLCGYLTATGMINSATDNPTGQANWIHVWSQTWGKTSANWASQIALGTNAGTGMWYRTTSGNIVGKGWTRVIDSANIGSQSVNYANSAGSANSVTWANVSGKPYSSFGTASQYNASATAGSKSTCAMTDSNGYINLYYINSNTSNSENPSISQIIVTNGSDNYYRKASLQHLKNSIGSLPASDVYSWAKASSKPSYGWSEITGKPSTFTPASHDHGSTYMKCAANAWGTSVTSGTITQNQMIVCYNQYHFLVWMPSTNDIQAVNLEDGSVVASGSGGPIRIYKNGQVDISLTRLNNPLRLQATAKGNCSMSIWYF